MFFFSSRRRHTRLQGDWSSDVCSSDLASSTSMRVAREWRATLVRISWKMRNIVVATSMSSLVDSGGSLTRARMPVQIGRASCRERVEISEVDVRTINEQIKQDR